MSRHSNCISGVISHLLPFEQEGCASTNSVRRPCSRSQAICREHFLGLALISLDTWSHPLPEVSAHGFVVAGQSTNTLSGRSQNQLSRLLISRTPLGVAMQLNDHIFKLFVWKLFWAASNFMFNNDLGNRTSG